MKPPESVKTPRLILRRPVLEDASPIFEGYARDPEVTRYLSWRPHESVERTQDFLRRCRDFWERNEAFPWVVVLKDEKRPIGMIDLRPQGNRVEIGYVLARSFWGRGYMTEASLVLIEWALSQPGIWRVWAVCDVDNAASARVLEKVGMVREGILRRWIIHPNISAEPRACYCYAVTK